MDPTLPSLPSGRWKLRRALPALFLLALALHAARTLRADPAGAIWGQGVDAIHGVWAHWWVLAPRESWSFTTAVGFPFGQHGSLLPQLGILCAQPVRWVLGPILACSLLNLAYLWFASLAAGLCAHRVAGTRLAGYAAAIAVFVERPLFFAAAEGNTEALAVGWFFLAIWAALGWIQPGVRRAQPVLVGLLFALAVIENPTTVVLAVPLAVVFAVARARRPGWRRDLPVAALVGAAAVAVHLALIGGAVGGNLARYQETEIWGLTWRYGDLAPLRAGWFRDLVSPWPSPSGTLDPYARLAAGGGSFLGWTVLALAGCSLFSWNRWPVLLSVACLAMAMGSVPFPEVRVPSPFLVANAVLGTVFPLLTSPYRHLPLAGMGFAVAAALGLQVFLGRVRGSWRRPVALGALALLVVEALSWGGGLAGAAHHALP